MFLVELSKAKTVTLEQLVAMFSPLKGMFGLPRFPLIFLCMKSKGTNFAWAYLITLSDRFYKNFLPKRSYSPGKRQNWILLFYPSGRTSTHIENVIPIWSRGRVAHCFNLLYNVRHRISERTAPYRWQRFESSCNQSVFNIFFLLGLHVLVLFFHLLIFFILCGLLYLI